MERSRNTKLSLELNDLDVGIVTMLLNSQYYRFSHFYRQRVMDRNI